MERFRWRQTTMVELGDEPEYLKLIVNSPKCAGLYFLTSSKVDYHNPCHQDALNTEKKIETKIWSRRVNTGILGIAIVDAWMLYKACSGSKR